MGNVFRRVAILLQVSNNGTQVLVSIQPQKSRPLHHSLCWLSNAYLLQKRHKGLQSVLYTVTQDRRMLYDDLHQAAYHFCCKEAGNLPMIQRHRRHFYTHVIIMFKQATMLCCDAARQSRYNFKPLCTSTTCSSDRPWFCRNWQTGSMSS